jgi:exosome complex component CSL4
MRKRLKPSSRDETKADSDGNDERGEETGDEVEETVQEQPEEDEHTEEGNLVLPGDVVGITEEFDGGDGTYTIRSDIFAARTGKVSVDKRKRRLTVKPASRIPPEIRKDDIVVGMITNVRDTMALMEIVAIKDSGEREINKQGIAAIHISNISKDYVKNIANEFGGSDIVKAKVIDIDNMRLSTAEKELGVISAMCPKCGSVMQKNRNILKCPECGNTEKRNLSSDYGSGEI